MGPTKAEINHANMAHNCRLMREAFAEEGIELRQAGIAAPILVFGAQLDCFFEQHLKHDLEITISRTDQIEPLQYLCKQLNKQAKVHIKIDSGMGRVGYYGNPGYL